VQWFHNDNTLCIAVFADDMNLTSDVLCHILLVLSTLLTPHGSSLSSAEVPGVEFWVSALCQASYAFQRVPMHPGTSWKVMEFYQ